MNTSHNSTSLSGGSYDADKILFGDSRYTWSVTLIEFIYFLSGFLFGCIVVFLGFVLRAKCRRSKRRNPVDERGNQDGPML